MPTTDGVRVGEPALRRSLLAECAGTPAPDWSRLTVPTIAAFVRTRANRLGP